MAAGGQQNDGGSVSANDLDMETTSGGFVDGAASQMLNEYSESKWGVVDDIDQDANIIELQEIVCDKTITRRLTYEDEEMFKELPIPKAEQTDLSELFVDLHAEERNQFIPDEFEEGIADFPFPETERVDVCTTCDGNGRVVCDTCSGGGRNACGRCGGDGVTGYGDAKSRCSKCGGSGSRVCGTCNGNGRLVCGTCEERGQSWKMDFIRREFTPHENIEIDAPGVPDEYIMEADGEYVRTEELDLGEGEIRHEREQREVPVAKLDYEYDNKDYSLYHVENELKAESYPMSRARRLLPFAVVSVVLLIGALYYFGVI